MINQKDIFDGNNYPATEARIRFGEVIRRAVDRHERFIVERAGQPQVIILSLNDYNQLKATQGESGRWRKLVQLAQERIETETQDKPLPHPAEVINNQRGARYKHILGLP
ncbi:MAG: type II toxin-antitoxin system Phd/YefM family antitoxin [Chloroflexota bacterium]